MDMNTIDFKNTVDENEGFDLTDGKISAVLWLTDDKYEEMFNRVDRAGNIEALYKETEMTFTVYADVSKNEDVTLTLVVSGDDFAQDYDVPITDEERKVLLGDIDRAARFYNQTLELLLMEARSEVGSYYKLDFKGCYECKDLPISNDFSVRNGYAVVKLTPKADTVGNLIERTEFDEVTAITASAENIEEMWEEGTISVCAYIPQDDNKEMWVDVILYPNPDDPTRGRYHFEAELIASERKELTDIINRELQSRFGIPLFPADGSKSKEQTNIEK